MGAHCLGQKDQVTDKDKQDEDSGIVWESHKELTEAGYNHVDKGSHNSNSNL